MNPVYSPTEQGYLRTRQRARYMIVFDPCPIVFQARVAMAPNVTDGTYLQIAYTDVTEGAYTDIKVGQTYVVSATTDHTLPLYDSGRINALPTSTLLNVAESGDTLSTTYYVTVLDTYEVKQRVRKGALVDGVLPFERQTPTITGVPSVSFKESSSTETFTLTAAGQATEDGEGIDTYEWSCLGQTSSTNTFTFDVPPDTYAWGQVTVTDTLGTPQTLNFRVINRKRFNSTLPTAVCDNPRIIRTWPGHHATIRAYKGVSIAQVMNGCACVIVSTAVLDGGSVDIDPVVFVGYLTKETSDSASASDRSTSFEIASAWELAAARPLNPIAIRDSATPTQWDDLNYPTPQRVVNHILSRYSTILNVCGLNLDDVGNTWYAGEYNVQSTSISDAMDQALSEINADITSRVSGELFLRRDLRMTDTTVRDAADVVWTLTTQDIGSLNYSVEHSQKVGRVIIGFRTFFTSRTDSKGGKAVAPSVILGSSPETQTRPNQLLPANLTDAQMLQEAAKRVGNLHAAENGTELSTTGRPQLQYLSPNNFQWIEIDLPGRVTRRNRVFAVRALLASLEIDYDVRTNGIGVSLELIPETQTGGALIVAMLTPNAASLTGVITPPLAAYGGSFFTPSTINLPDENTRRPFRRKDMGGMAPPLPADQAANEGNANGQGNERSFAISFANPDPVGAGFTSLNGATYRVTVSGSALIGTAQMTLDYNFLEDDYADQGISGDVDGNTAAWTLGVGWQGTTVDALDRCYVKKTFDDPTPVVSATEYWANFTDDTNANYRIGINGGYGPVNSMILGQTSGSVDIDDTATTLYAGFERSGFAEGFVANLTRLVIVIAAGGGDLYADPFYSYEKGEGEDEGQEINVSYLGTTKGFQINGVPIAVPPVYNPAHTYTFEWEGDGNIPEVLFADNDHSDNQNLPLYVTFEGPGAGT